LRGYAWLQGFSTGTLRKGPYTVTPKLHAASLDAFTLAQLAGDRVFASDLKRKRGTALRFAKGEVCRCGTGPCDWWHYFVNCTAVVAQREELILQLQTAADVRSQDSAATHWLQAASTLRGALPWSAVVETALKRALAVGGGSTATSFDRRALVGAADKVAEAVLSLVREAKAINGVLGGRATASHQAASQLRAGFGRWAERTAAVGPGAIALLRADRAEIAARAGDFYVTNGAYPEPAILRAVLALPPARGVTPAGNSGQWGPRIQDDVFTSGPHSQSRLVCRSRGRSRLGSTTWCPSPVVAAGGGVETFVRFWTGASCSNGARGLRHHHLHHRRRLRRL